MSYYYKGVKDLLEERGYKEEFYINGGDGYDWHTAVVFSLKDGRRKPKIFYIQQAGCSCNSFGEDFNTADDVIGEMVELSSLSAAQDLIKSMREITDQEYDTLVEKFRALRLR